LRKDAVVDFFPPTVRVIFELPRQVTYTQRAFEEYPVKKKNDGMNLLLIIK